MCGYMIVMMDANANINANDDDVKGAG